MFSLFYGFIQWLFSKTEVQILIIGLDYAGKTTLLEQMKGLYSSTAGIPLDKIPPTVGLNIGRMDVGGCRVIFWDLGGQVNLRSIWDHYYSEAQGLLFLVDAADPARFAEARAALGTITRHSALDGVPLLVLANKMDLAEAVPVAEVNAGLGVDAIVDEGTRACRLRGASALTLQGVKDAVGWLVGVVKARGAAARAGGGGAGAAEPAAKPLVRRVR